MRARPGASYPEWYAGGAPDGVSLRVRRYPRARWHAVEPVRRRRRPKGAAKTAAPAPAPAAGGGSSGGRRQSGRPLDIGVGGLVIAFHLGRGRGQYESDKKITCLTDGLAATQAARGENQHAAAFQHAAVCPTSGLVRLPDSATPEKEQSRRRLQGRQVAGGGGGGRTEEGGWGKGV